jgi:YVTN family beta-propeller protein
MNRLIPLLFLLLTILGCEKEKPLTDPVIPDIQNKKGLLVVNEGNYMFGNASVSYYNFSDNSATEDLFKPKNNRPLGDVAQSITIADAKAYIVVNNSGKIEVVNLSDFSSTGTISGLTSPRYMQYISSQKAYISDLYANKVNIINPSTKAVTGSIAINGWTEKMLYAANKIFVSNMKSEYVYVINAQTDQLTDSIKAGYASNSIVEDKNGRIWVLCSGDSSLNHKARLAMINPSTHAIEKSFEFPDKTDSPWKLSIDNKDNLYFLNKGLWKMPLNSSSLPTSAMINSNGKNFNSIAIDPDNEEIFIADAIDYIQKGKVYYYSSNGALKFSFSTGIIPGEMVFIK